MQKQFLPKRQFNKKSWHCTKTNPKQLALV